MGSFEVSSGHLDEVGRRWGSDPSDPLTGSAAPSLPPPLGFGTFPDLLNSHGSLLHWLLQLPRFSTMTTISPELKGLDRAVLAVNTFIQILNIARDACGTYSSSSSRLRFR